MRRPQNVEQSNKNGSTLFLFINLKNNNDTSWSNVLANQVYLMNAEQKLLLLNKCSSSKAVYSLFELFTDLDNSDVQYSTVTIDILDELKEFNPGNLDDETLKSFQKTLADYLKDGKTKFDFDVCIRLKNHDTNTSSDTYWVFNVDEVPTAESLRNTTWRSLASPMDSSLGLLFEDDRFRSFTDEFFKSLDRKYSYPQTLAENIANPQWLTPKTYYPWFSGMWSNDNLAGKDDTQNFASEADFLKVLLGDIGFKKAVERRKQRYLNLNPALKAQREGYLKDLVTELLKSQTKVRELRDSEITKLLASVDKILYKLHPEYKEISLA